MSQPSGQLGALVQGIWSASVPQPEPVMRRLYSDAGSGIVFNLSGEVMIGNEVLPEGVIMRSVDKQAENIVLSAGARICGIRFHPAIGYGVLGRHYHRPTLLLPEQDELYDLYALWAELQQLRVMDDQVQMLTSWAQTHLDFTHVIPDHLEKAFEHIDQNEALGDLSDSVALSQRQIERLFKRWLGMTPKHYQRILRIKQAICYLREHPDASLVDVAQQFGFSDQAHMTREFRSIARTTPGQL